MTQLDPNEVLGWLKPLANLLAPPKFGLNTAKPLWQIRHTPIGQQLQGTRSTPTGQCVQASSCMPPLSHHRSECRTQRLQVVARQPGVLTEEHAFWYGVVHTAL